MPLRGGRLLRSVKTGWGGCRLAFSGRACPRHGADRYCLAAPREIDPGLHCGKLWFTLPCYRGTRGSSSRNDPPPESDRSVNVRVLVTNDDGIDSPGLKALADMARQRGHDVVVAAPGWDASGASASVTGVSQTGEVITESRSWEGWEEGKVLSLDATPALIVFYALHERLGERPDSCPLRYQPGCQYRSDHSPFRDRWGRPDGLSTGLQCARRVIGGPRHGHIRPGALGHGGGRGRPGL